MYVAYNGWFSSGDSVWKVDKISFRDKKTNEYLSDCRHTDSEKVLRSGIVSSFSLMTGDCAMMPATNLALTSESTTLVEEPLKK